MVEVNFSFNETTVLKKLIENQCNTYLRIIQNYNPNTIDNYNEIAEDYKYLSRALKKLRDGENYFYDHATDFCLYD